MDGFRNIEIKNFRGIDRHPANDLVELAKRRLKDAVAEQLKLFDSLHYSAPGVY